MSLMFENEIKKKLQFDIILNNEVNLDFQHGKHTFFSKKLKIKKNN
jgi:hypothetical protein